jgi:glycerol-1-phosphate dehydrogenase [NAD(P)+]
MERFSEMALNELLVPGGHACACGRTHTTGLKFLRVGRGAISAIPEALRFLNKSKPFVVSDANTYRAAGMQVEAILKSAGIPFCSYTYPESAGHIEPDEHAVGCLTMAMDPSCDIVMAVGSGVINDCCKVLAHAAGIPSLAVGTAPSMDGYASNSASMIRSKIKVTLYNACPAAIIADTDIMKDAPLRMLWAGLGDMLAKYNAICEWRISNIVTGEFYCENIAGLVRKSVAKVTENADGLVLRAPEAVEAVIEGLILSGVAMDFAKISRPASGLEHYFSHIWEMEALRNGRESDLHGIQVGVGLCLTLPVLDRLRAYVPNRKTAEDAMAGFSNDAWESEMRAIFGATAEELIPMEHTMWHKNDPEAHRKRLDILLSRWDEILRTIDEEVPDTKALLAMMRKTGMPTTAEELGLTAAQARSAFIGSREIRDKYLTTSLLWDLGVLHTFGY